MDQTAKRKQCSCERQFQFRKHLWRTNSYQKMANVRSSLRFFLHWERYHHLYDQKMAPFHRPLGASCQMDKIKRKRQQSHHNQANRRRIPKKSWKFNHFWTGSCNRKRKRRYRSNIRSYFSQINVQKCWNS